MALSTHEMRVFLINFMANLSKVIYINEVDYSTLLNGGTITKGGVTYSHDPTALYVIKNVSAPEYAETAGYATTAGQATKATQDGGGNVISETYAKKATSVQTISVNDASLSPTDGNISISAVTGLQFDGSSHVGAVQLPEYVKKSDYDTAIAEYVKKSDYNTTIDDIYQSIPSDLADMADDATHRVVTDTEKSTWNGKQDAISDLATIRSGAAAGATALQSHQPLKTINGESIVGTGDIETGSGDVATAFTITITSTTIEVQPMTGAMMTVGTDVSFQVV